MCARAELGSGAYLVMGGDGQLGAVGRVHAGWVIAEPATIRRMVGFRVVLPAASVLDVPDAADYVVTDDGALVLRTGEHELLRLPADGWLEVCALAVGPPQNVEFLLDELCSGL